MNLVLEIEYLSGVSFAAIGPDSPTPEWPPQPDRIFSALVASWAARGKNGTEGSALEWLERQPVPQILELGAEPRTSAIVYVPPNDPRSNIKDRSREVLPALRSRQPRRFPAARPIDPVVQWIWKQVAPTEDVLAALQLLARDTAYVGHSTSLTRCRFRLEAVTPNHESARAARRRVYAGRLAELRTAYATFEQSAGKRGRPLPGSHVAPAVIPKVERTNVFGEHWLLLEHVGGDMADLRACALVAKAIRDTILSGYKRIGKEARIPEVVSGHGTDGTPARSMHIAIVPMAFAGFPYADGHVLGFALVPPRESKILDDVDFRSALRQLAPIDERRGRRVLTVRPNSGRPLPNGFSISLSPTLEPSARSMDSGLYLGPARTFATSTPIVLDRHLKETGAARQDEIAAQIASACRNIGLPEPELVVADKHSAVEGVPSAYPSGKSPRWTGWSLPPSLTSRQLTHATIRFAEPVHGPVLLGAGRYVGLGLCPPLD